MRATSTPPPLPAEREGRPAAADLAARRQGLSAAVAAGFGRTDPLPEEICVGGVRALRFAPDGVSLGTVLHVHGGAFRIGAPEVVAPFAAALSARCGVTVVCPAYRLAPEHPFPAGINDARAVALALAADGPLILSGDSAGGGVAAAAAALATADAVPPAGLMLFSPWLDLTVSSASYAANGTSDPLFSAESAQEAAGLYLQGLDPNDPLGSPLFAPAAGFPPTLVNVGDGEVLLDDSTSFAAALRAAGVAVELQVVAGMDHVAVTRDLAAPGAAETFEALCAFVDRIVAAG
ncbi:alpha/beta hydrolase fold domain-containing protein [Sphingomonas solaris]|uniref:Alpha/beta hydrolase n=1 Tax=Alterirhizorhabdus solaris TaxID=2529389 RepID=A0A558RBS2_9SPHN|nr:alpha/beta hydrolase fold domain-containing protein [Sphingomonas solaris]TVV76712.1 alpha/beta hydrolase [Sphingomonas solaris]